MAETFLAPVIDKLTELLAEEVTSLVKGVSKEVESLKDELKIIQPFLKDAEAKLEKGEVNDATKEWLKQIREVGDRIEEVVDEHLYNLSKRRHEERGFIGSLRKAGNSVRTLKLHHDLAAKIQYIKKSLCKITERGQRYGLRLFEQAISTATNVDAPVIDPRLGSLFIEEDEFVGIDSISEEIVRSLVEGPSRRSVISLVGVGGIGKTTLARKVYNDEVVRQHFECFAWITVSQSYNMEKVLKLMKNQICQSEEEPLGTIEGLADLLRKYLQTKRYVIVFDDVWKINFLEDIKLILPNKNKSDRIVITTRNMTIANDGKDAISDPVQKLETWSQELAWDLFCKKAFRFEFEVGCCPKELEPLSSKILSKCQGLPLAIAAIAGLLSRKGKSELEWQRVHDNLDYEFQKNPLLSSVSKILSFSYHDLPYYLKSCFLYFGIFPEDYLIYESRLYSLWIAEDFIKSKGDKELEQVAKEYLSELIHRNLVSFEIKGGVERWCRVHDLIRDIILTRVDELCFCQIINENKLKFEGKCSRRLSIIGATNDILNLVVNTTKIRSIFLFNIDHELTESFLSSLFEKFKFLKILDFEDALLDKLPKEIGNLFNLKYLNMRGTTMKILPKCIGKLQNLQTLTFIESLVQELPIEIKKLRSLRHLSAKSIIFHDSRYGVRTHDGLGSLVELHTLANVIVYPSTTNLGNELEKLKKLKILSIQELTPEIMNDLGASIEKMNQLERLYLNSINGDKPLDLKCISSPPPLLCYLRLECQQQQLPVWISKLENLQGLDLTNSRLSSEPLKCLKGLPNLVYLHMYQAYEGKELHFEEGVFKKLKELRLRQLKGLKVVKIDKGALSSLEKLDFGPFPLMMEMPSDIQHLTNLKSLEINDMPREFVVGLQPNEGTQYWKIQHVPSVSFWYEYKRNNYNIYKLGSSEFVATSERASRSINSSKSIRWPHNRV